MRTFIFAFQPRRLGFLAKPVSATRNPKKRRGRTKPRLCEHADPEYFFIERPFRRVKPVSPQAMAISLHKARHSAKRWLFAPPKSFRGTCLPKAHRHDVFSTFSSFHFHLVQKLR